MPRQPAVPAKLCLSFQEPAAKKKRQVGPGREAGRRGKQEEGALGWFGEGEENTHIREHRHSSCGRVAQAKLAAAAAEVFNLH